MRDEIKLPHSNNDVIVLRDFQIRYFCVWFFKRVNVC